jgi:hypothetical protein
MTKEERAVALALLICFLYGLGYLIQFGVFLLPTPLFPLVSLISGGYICFSSFSAAPKTALIFGSALFLKFLTSTFALMFFLNEETHGVYMKSAIPELLKTGMYLFFIGGSMIVFLRTESRYKYIFLSSFVLIFASSVVFNASALLGTAYLLVFIYSKLGISELQVFGLIHLLLAVFEYSQGIFLLYTN